MRPLAFDLFCGLGGWAEGFLVEGYDVIGFDVERHDYGTGGYPGQLVIQDVLTLDGAQLRHAAAIVASPPCQKYSYMAMPWGRAKTEIAWQKWFRDSGSPFADPFTLNDLFDACFRIQREASAAAGHPIPMVVENVKGAQPWVGRAAWHYGSFYLWGDVPALMPWSGRTVKVDGFNFHQHENGGKGGSFQSAAVAATKVPGQDWSRYAKTGEVSPHWRMEEQKNGERKGTGGSWFTPEADGRTKQGHWRDGGCVTRCFNSKDSRRKAASAQIAKIPFPLAQHIAQVFKPRS